MSTHKAFKQLSETLEAALPGLSEVERAAIAQGWVNECGGSRYYEIAQEIEELSKGNKVETDPELFEKTRRIFQEAGKSDLEHLMWREKDTRIACLVELMKICREVNPGFEPDDEDYIPIPRERPNKELTITRSQLESAVARDYVEHGTEYINILEKPELNNGQPQPQPEPEPQPEPQPQPQNARNTSQCQEKSRKNNLPRITYSDLVGEELTAKEVINWIRGVQPEIDKEDMDPMKRLSDYACRASRGQPKGQLTEPLRLQKGKDSRWSQIALIHKGNSGPGGGNKYKLVRSDATN